MFCDDQAYNGEWVLPALCGFFMDFYFVLFHKLIELEAT